MIATVVRRMMLVVGVVVVMPWPGTAAPQSRAESDILDRTANYVKAFVRGFSNVVAEERYVQTANPNNPGPGPRQRVLLSDFLLVKGQAANDWYQFRDVRWVDGKPVLDRARRLTELFLEPWDTAIKQASRIASEGARHNLFNVGTINFPLLGLALLQPHYRDRLEFSIGRVERDGGRELRVIIFRESNVPNTVIGGMRSSGRAWVDEATGRVMKTELELRNAVQKFAYTITTTFVFDERLQLAVPAEMRDSYPGFLDMTGVATYGKFRTFQVRTTEQVRK
jgi:hypothetical protein